MGNKISKKSESLDNWNNIHTDSMSSNIMPKFEHINQESKELIRSLNLNDKFKINSVNSDSEIDNIFINKPNKPDELNFSDTSPFISAEIHKYQTGGAKSKKNEMLTSSSSSLKNSDSKVNSNNSSDIDLSYVSSSAHTHESSEKNHNNSLESTDILSDNSEDNHNNSADSTEIFSKDTDNHNNSLESTEIKNNSEKTTTDNTISVKNNSMLSTSINTSDINVISE